MIDLFGNPDASTEPKEKLGRLELMHRRYGHHTGTCKDCLHLLDDQYHGKNYYKCELYGESRGAGTDWRLSWEACGKHEESHD